MATTRSTLPARLKFATSPPITPKNQKGLVTSKVPYYVDWSQEGFPLMRYSLTRVGLSSYLVNAGENFLWPILPSAGKNLGDLRALFEFANHVLNQSWDPYMVSPEDLQTIQAKLTSSKDLSATPENPFTDDFHEVLVDPDVHFKFVIDENEDPSIATISISGQGWELFIGEDDSFLNMGDGALVFDFENGTLREIVKEICRVISQGWETSV